jgi:hypothetical protein
MADTTLNISLEDYISQIQKGLRPGESILRGFGEREAMGTTASGEDLWRGNELTPAASVEIPIPPDAGDLISVTFENSADTLVGTGVQKLDVHALDPTGVPITIPVDANGGTVDTGVAARFIQYLHTTQTGSNDAAVGHIKVHKTGDATKIYNMLALGGHKSMTTNRMVPLGKKLLLKKWDAQEAQGKRVAYRIHSTDDEGVINPRIFIFKDVTYLNKTTTGQLTVLDVVPELSIVKISAWPDAAGAEGSASWWGILVDK